MIDRDLQQAVESFDAGDHARAEALCRQVLAQAPGNPHAQHLLGILRLQGGHAAEAIPLLREALQADATNLSVLDALSAALMAVGDYAQAEAMVRRALAVNSELPVASARLGMALASQGKWGEAAQSFEEAIRGDPQFAEAHHSLGNALRELRRPQQAVACFGRALALDPGNADTHNALGTVLLEQGGLEEAARCFERAIAAQPGYAQAHCNLGVVLKERGKWEEAIAQFERALELDPAFADAHYNLGLARLYHHDFARAWPGFERRLQCKVGLTSKRADPASVDLYARLPRWGGPGEAGVGEVAIWGEQGIGDQVLFSTLIPELVAAGVSFVYEVDGRLLGAYERAFPGARFVALGEPPQEVLQRASRVLLAGSLPGIFRGTRESFGRQPRKLLGALAQRVAHYRGRLDALGPGLKVALSWRSRREDRLGLSKSAPLLEFAPLLALPGVRFVDVQYGDTAEERGAVEAATGVRLLHFDEVDYTHDLEELLAILEACDLVVTTSNATAHFAGALGQRTWLLYLADQAPFHYWSHGGSYHSLWYPSVEIVTAPHLTEWASLIQHTAQKLARLVKRGN